MQRTPKRWIHILTIWQERPAAPPQPAVWRFSLEDIHDGKRRVFASPGTLMAFLWAQMNADQEDQESDDVTTSPDSTPFQEL